MLEKNNRYKVLKVFLFNPTESFRLRELSRLAKLSPPSVIAYLKQFEKQGLINKYVKRSIPFYKAEIDNEKFKHYKKISILFELYNSRLIDYLWENLSPDALILYGSYAKGESTESSDIDIFVIGKEKKLNLEKYEQELGTDIHIIFNNDPKTIPKELKNNLINGITLKGYFKVF
jgi:predicted nucleotidyltransferase